MKSTNRITIGIDNGTSGSIAIIGPDGSIFEPMPTKKALMGKAGKVIKRIDHVKLWSIIIGCLPSDRSTAHAFIERPFTGSPMMINTCVLSARSFEAVLIVLEQADIGYTVVDSKEWQKAVLGVGVKGSAALKEASALRGAQIYPTHRAAIASQGDADGLLIAHHYHKR